MGAKRASYNVVARYMDGNKVTGYHLKSTDGLKHGRYTREQLCYLVGRNQVENCVGKVHKDTVVLSGKNMKLTELPVYNGDDSISDNENGSSDSNDNKGVLVAALVATNVVVGYIVKKDNKELKISREKVLSLASEGRISNAKTQNYKGKLLLRGNGINLRDLPRIDINADGESDTKPKASDTKPKVSDTKTKDKSDITAERIKEYIEYLGNNREYLKKPAEVMINYFRYDLGEVCILICVVDTNLDLIILKGNESILSRKKVKSIEKILALIVSKEHELRLGD